MSVSDNDKLAENLLARNYLVTALPIKKRPVILVLPSSPPLPPQDGERPQGKPSLSDLHSASNRGSQPSVTTILANEGSCWEPEVEEFIVKSDPDTITKCESLLGPDRGESWLANFSEDSTLDRKPTFQALMESAKVLSPSMGSKLFAEASSLEQNCSSNLSAECGSDSERKVDHGMNLDLNIPMGAWDENLSSSMKKQGDIERKETGLGRDVRLGKCMRQKSNCNLGHGNFLDSNEQNDSKVSLDLQLKPPCRPHPRFSCLGISHGKKDSDPEMFDLSLSLAGNRINPESCGNGIEENREVDFDLQNSTRTVHAKSELCEEQPSNLISDCSGSSKVVPPDDPQEHSKGIGVVSSPKVMSYDRKTTSVMEVPHNSCPSKVNDFYSKLKNSCGSKVEDLYNKFEIDLNSLPVDSDHGFHSATNSSKPMEMVSQDHCADNSDTRDHDELLKSSSSSTDVEGIVAKISTSVLEPMELAQKELNSAKDVSGADGRVPELSQGNKPAAPDHLSEDDSTMVGSGHNDSISAKVASDEVPTELDGNDDVAKSNEEIEEFEEVVQEGSSDEELDSSKQVVDDGDTDPEEYEECDDETDSSPHHAGGAENAKLDSPHDEYGDGGQREENVLHGKKDANPIPATPLTMMPSQGDAIAKHIQKFQKCTDKRELEVTMPENLRPSALDVPSTARKKPLNATWTTDQDQGRKSRWDKEIVAATEAGNTKQGCGTWETKSSLNKDIVEATDPGNTKQGCGTWGRKSSFGKDIAEATEKSDCEISRRENSRMMYSAADGDDGDAKKHEEPWVKCSRVIKLNPGSERSSYEKGKPNHAKPIWSRIRRDGSSDKSFRRDKPHPHNDRGDRRNERFHRSENNMNGHNQFGMRRSEYSWVRKDGRKNDGSLHSHRSFLSTENAQECTDAVPSSRRQVHDARGEQVQSGSQMIHRAIRNVSPSVRYIGRTVLDSQLPQANEEQLVTRDLPSSSMNHPAFFHNNDTDLPGSLEHSSEAWLRSQLTAEHENMRSSQQRLNYPHNRHGSVPDNEREPNPSDLQYSEPVSSLQRNINQRGFDIDRRQTQEEIFGHSRHNHDEQEKMTHTHSSDQRDYGVQNSPPRPDPYGRRVHKCFHEREVSDRNIRNRLGEIPNGEQTADAEIYDERQYSVENNSRHARYDHRSRKNFQRRGNPREFKGNIRNRLGDTSNGARSAREQEGNNRFRGRKGWDDAGAKRRKY